MDWQRTVLLGAMGVVVWLLVIQWTQFEEAHSPVVSRETSEVIIPSDNLLPEVVEADELPEIVSLEKVESASYMSWRSRNKVFATATCIRSIN